MSTQTYTGKLVVQDCCACGLTFGVPASYDRDRRGDQKSFSCPAGHWQSYTGKTDAQKAAEATALAKQERERAERLERQLANRDEDLRVERAAHKQTEGRRRAAKGQLTKTRNRVAKGVCPCCNRHFADVQRHMENQHPDYAEASNA